MTAPALAGAYLTWQALDAIADAAWAAVRRLLAALAGGLVTVAEAVELITDVLVAYVVQAEAIGRVRGLDDADRPVNGTTFVPPVAAEHRRVPDEFIQTTADAPELTEEQIQNPYNIEIRDEELRERLHEAVETVVREEGLPQTADEPAPRLERLVRDEPIQAVQRGYQDGIRVAVASPERPRATSVGYRRGVNPDCCELCYWLWKEGYVYPIHKPMHRHPGCRCVPVPTTDPVGKWKLSDEEESLLSDLYAKYSAKTSGGSDA